MDDDKDNFKAIDMSGINSDSIERFKLVDLDNGELQYTGEASMYVRVTSANGEVRKIKLADGDKVQIGNDD